MHGCRGKTSKAAGTAAGTQPRQAGTAADLGVEREVREVLVVEEEDGVVGQLHREAPHERDVVSEHLFLRKVELVCDDAVHVVVGQKEPDRSAGRDVVEQEHYRLFMWDEEGGGGMQGRYHGEGEIMVRAREPEPLPYPSIPPSPTLIMWDARARGVA